MSSASAGVCVVHLEDIYRREHGPPSQLLGVKRIPRPGAKLLQVIFTNLATLLPTAQAPIAASSSTNSINLQLQERQSLPQLNHG